MREITIHHDGHGLNESIKIEADEPGPGGASHAYTLSIDGLEVARIQFQKGPRNIEGSTPGVVERALLAVVRDRLETFQSGEFACHENAMALEEVVAAMDWQKIRSDNRANRGVLGTYAK